MAVSFERKDTGPLGTSGSDGEIPGVWMPARDSP